MKGGGAWFELRRFLRGLLARDLLGSSLQLECRALRPVGVELSVGATISPARELCGIDGREILAHVLS